MTSSEATHTSRADWLAAARIGAFMHYLPSTAEEFAQARQFDVEALADQLDEVGMRYFIFTLGQNAGWFNAPNDAYERLVPGRCATRDLPAELWEALSRRGIRLMLYLPCQPPNRDQVAQAAFGLEQGDKDQILTQACVSAWAGVIEAWSLHYGPRVSGWWFDGAYRHLEFNEAIATTYAAVARRGNPDSILTFNPCVGLFRFTQAEDYTAGELNEPLEVVPASRWVDGSQWHALTYLGSGWGRRDVRHKPSQWQAWLQNVWAHNGAVTLDIGPNMNSADGPIGSVSPDQFAQLKQINARSLVPLGRHPPL